MILKNIQNFRAIKLASGMVNSAVDLVLPPRCPVSLEVVDRQGMIAPEAWARLHFITSPLCRTCGIPLEVDVGKEADCGGCITENTIYDKARSALVYDENSRGVILGFKHGDQTHAVVSFIPWLKQAGAELIAQSDLIVPVPLHRWRLLHRRFNQSALMASALAKICGKKAGIQTLIRTRATPTQGYLRAGERARNVKAAFALHPAADVREKNILLIDDVYTTGATVSECAKALKEGGAATVNILTLARVVKPGKIL